MDREEGSLAAGRISKTFELAKQVSHGRVVLRDADASHPRTALRERTHRGRWLGKLAAELVLTPGAAHFLQVIVERGKERRVRANGRAQEHDGAVHVILGFLIERREPEPARLGALGVLGGLRGSGGLGGLGGKFPRAGRQREQQRRGYRARSNRRLSRSDRAIV